MRRYDVASTFIRRSFDVFYVCWKCPLTPAIATLSHEINRLIIFFFRLFEAEPDMRSLFPKVFQINSDNQLEIDIDRDLLKKHAAIVMEGLGAVVEIMDDSDFLNNVLISIGQTHYHRHVRPSMLKVSIDKKDQLIVTATILIIGWLLYA